MTDRKAPAKEAVTDERLAALVTFYHGDNGALFGSFLADALAELQSRRSADPARTALFEALKLALACEPDDWRIWRQNALDAVAMMGQSRRSAAPGRGESGGILPTVSEASMNKVLERFRLARINGEFDASVTLRMPGEPLLATLLDDIEAALSTKPECPPTEEAIAQRVNAELPYAGPWAEAETDRRELCLRIARALACSPAPLPAEESNAIQGSSSDVVQNKEEKK